MFHSLNASSISNFYFQSPFFKVLKTSIEITLCSDQKDLLRNIDFISMAQFCCDFNANRVSIAPYLKFLRFLLGRLPLLPLEHTQKGVIYEIIFEFTTSLVSSENIVSSI
jgi:hypothetical protein